MSQKHPIEGAIARMSKRDQGIARRLYEAGNSDEDLLAMLASPNVERLLRQPIGGKQPIAPSPSGSIAGDGGGNSDGS